METARAGSRGVAGAPAGDVSADPGLDRRGPRVGGWRRPGHDGGHRACRRPGTPPGAGRPRAVPAAAATGFRPGGGRAPHDLDGGNGDHRHGERPARAARPSASGRTGRVPAGDRLSGDSDRMDRRRDRRGRRRRISDLQELGRHRRLVPAHVGRHPRGVQGGRADRMALRVQSHGHARRHGSTA